MPLMPRVLERYPTHADRLAAAVVRLFQAGRPLAQALDDVAESEALTPLGRERVLDKVELLLGINLPEEVTP